MPEVYLSGGDTLQSVDNPNWQGQTFRVLENTVLNFIDLEMKGAMIATSPVILVFHADSSHEPFGDYLSRDRHIVEAKSGVFNTGRVRFSMVPYTLTTDFYYVIIVANYPGLLGNPASWQYDKDNGSYPRGHRISSPDSGATWTQHYHDDFMFAVFGDPPLPKPEPPPPIDYFATLAGEYFHNPTSITFTLSTSVPCHLWCYYTDKKPLRHRSARTVRGLLIPWGAYFCFVAYKKVEQTEKGDTFTHTFEIPDWQLCQTKWFTFRGEVDTVKAPSVGPIFKHHHSGIDSFANLSFENYPITPGVPPSWKATSYGMGTGAYFRDTVNVQHGIYSCKVNAVGMNYQARLRQTRWSTPYLNKTAKLTINWFGSGRGNVAGFSGFAAFNFGPGWHTWSKTATFGATPSLLTIQLSTGGAGSASTQLTWDNITIEIL